MNEKQEGHLAEATIGFSDPNYLQQICQLRNLPHLKSTPISMVSVHFTSTLTMQLKQSSTKSNLDQKLSKVLCRLGPILPRRLRLAYTRSSCQAQPSQLQGTKTSKHGYTEFSHQPPTRPLNPTLMIPIFSF